MLKENPNANMESGSNSSDTSGLATTLPVIIEIKVKPDMVKKKFRFRKNKINIHVNSSNVASANGRTQASRHQSIADKEFASVRNRFNSIENLTFTTHPNKNSSDDKWRIFERKPNDKFNKNIREHLSKNLLAISSDLPDDNRIQNTASESNSESECHCNIESHYGITEKLSDNEVVVKPLNQIVIRDDSNERPLSSHSSTSSSGSSVIVREFKGVSSYSSVVKMDNFVENQTMESQPGLLAMSAISKWEKGETTGTFISSKINPDWLKINNEQISPSSTSISKTKTQKAIASKNETVTNKGDKTQKVEKQNTTVRLNDTPQSNENKENIVWILDYLTIRNSLRHSNELEKIKLLEALRWQVIRSLPSKRDKVLEELTKSDIFEIRSAYKSKNLLDILLWPLNEFKESLTVQNYTARLLNAIVSSKIGREYFTNVPIIQSLIWDSTDSGGQNVQPFRRNFIEVGTVQHITASMAKLSLDLFQQHDMLQKGVLIWIINQLEDIEYSGDIYHFKYLLKFLMNVTLSPKQYNISDDKTREVLTLLSRILDNMDMKSCHVDIFRIFLNLFQQPKIVSIAKSMNFSSIFSDKLNRVPGVNQKKILESLTSVLLGKTSKVVIKDVDRDFVANGSYFDNELDTPEPYDNFSIHGNQFLQKYYALSQKKSFLRLDDHLEVKYVYNMSDRSFIEETMDFKHVPRKDRIFSKQRYLFTKREKDQRFKKTDFNVAKFKVPEIILTRDSKMSADSDEKESIVTSNVDFDNSVTEMQKKVNEIRKEFRPKKQETLEKIENKTQDLVTEQVTETQGSEAAITTAIFHSDPHNESIIAIESKQKDETNEDAKEKIEGSKEQRIAGGIGIAPGKRNLISEYPKPSVNLQSQVTSTVPSTAITAERNTTAGKNVKFVILPAIDNNDKINNNSNNKTMTLPLISQNTNQKFANVSNAGADEHVNYTQKPNVRIDTEIKLPETSAKKHEENVNRKSKNKRSYSLESYYYYYRKETIIEKDRRIKSD